MLFNKNISSNVFHTLFPCCFYFAPPGSEESGPWKINSSSGTRACTTGVIIIIIKKKLLWRGAMLRNFSWYFDGGHLSTTMTNFANQRCSEWTDLVSEKTPWLGCRPGAEVTPGMAIIVMWQLMWILIFMFMHELVWLALEYGFFCGNKIQFCSWVWIFCDIKTLKAW
jgi:hypothetical protein